VPMWASFRTTEGIGGLDPDLLTQDRGDSSAIGPASDCRGYLLRVEPAPPASLECSTGGREARIEGLILISLAGLGGASGSRVHGREVAAPARTPRPACPLWGGWAECFVVPPHPHLPSPFFSCCVFSS